MSVALALVCAVLWGTADFVGGTATRRSSASVVLFWSIVAVLPVVAIIAVVSGDLQMYSVATPWGAAAGLTACVGILSLYRGLSTGVMGVVAPIASTSVIVPVVVGLLTGSTIGALCAAGIVLAVIGVVLAGGPNLREFRTGGHRPLLFALGAAAGIGLSLVAVARGSDTSTITTLAVSRLAYLAVLVPVVMAGRATVRTGDRTTLRLAVMAGFGDVAAVGLYGLATRSGPVAVTAALASMFPIATLLLARRIDGERLVREQVVGVVLALAGVVVIVTTQ
jgi:drug/metabolite transporter (DMT)-like permease